MILIAIAVDVAVATGARITDVRIIISINQQMPTTSAQVILAGSMMRETLGGKMKKMPTVSFNGFATWT